MSLSQIFVPFRAWWFLQIARNATPSPEIRRYLMERIERQRREVVCEGAAAGKTISTEAALKHVLELKTTYAGPNREEYVCEIDRFADDFRKKYGPQVPVDQAYAMLKELEARFGRVE